ncbi:MAG: helix-turn-helix domain-containing protein [Butyricicoccaceae bacterium]
MNDELLTVKQTKEVLKIGENRVYDLLNSGLIPYLKLGGYKVRRSSLELFMKEYEGCDLTDLTNIKKIVKKDSAP